MAPNVTDDFISKCAYDVKRDPYCPTFTIEQIINQAETDPIERLEMLKKGGVILIGIDWECNYDFSKNPCVLSYQFDRYDLKFSESKATSGFNFRFADKFEINGTMYRELHKAFGLRFIIQVTGKEGKFDFVPLLLTIGAGKKFRKIPILKIILKILNFCLGFGLLSVATLVADFIILYIIKEKKFYQSLKILDYKNDIEV